MTGETIKGVVVPVVASIITGVSASFISIQIAVEVLETRLGYVERNVQTLVSMQAQLTTLRLESARQGQWIESTDKHLVKLDQDVDAIQALIRPGTTAY